MEKHKKFVPADVDKAINVQEFEPFTQMIFGLLQDSVDRLKGGRSLIWIKKPYCRFVNLLRFMIILRIICVT